MGTRSSQPTVQKTETCDDTLVVPRLLRRREAAGYLGISTAHLDQLRAMGQIEVVRMPGRNGVPIRTPLFDRVILDAAIERWKNGGAR